MNKLRSALYLITAFVACNTSVFSQNRAVRFETTSFDLVKAKAIKENKIIFITICTNWCAPCKWMKKTLYTNDTVADYCNAKFINFEVDATLGLNKEFTRTGEVECFPNLMFMDADGKVVHRFCGAPQTAQEMIDMLSKVFDTPNTFGYYYYSYKLNKNNPKFLMDYIQVLQKTQLPYEKILAEYFKTQKDEQLTTRVNWEVLKANCQDNRSNEFNYFIRHQAVYKKLYTDDSVNTAMVDIVERIIQELLVFNNYVIKESEFLYFCNQIALLDSPVKEQELFMARVFYYRKTHNRKAMFDLIHNEGKQYFEKIRDEDIASSVAEYAEDTVCLRLASAHFRMLLTRMALYDNNESNISYIANLNKKYAQVMYKLNDKKEALRAVQLSLSGFSKDDTNKERYNEAEELYKKILKMPDE